MQPTDREAHTKEMIGIMNGLRSHIIEPGRGKGWRIRNKNILLFYQDKGLIEREDVREFMLSKGALEKFFVIHKEVSGSALGITIIYLSYVDAIDTSKQNFFDLNVEGQIISPMIYLVPKVSGCSAVLKYLAKINEAAADEYFDGDLSEWADHGAKSLAEKVWACKSLSDALIKYGKECSDAGGITTFWENRPQAEEVVEEKIEEELRYQWHSDLWQDLTGPHWNHRRLKWIVDRDGGKDKSNFCLRFKKEFGGIILKTACGASNIATLIDERIKCGLSVKYILIDLPRAAQTHKMWDTIEGLMDGVVTVLKYKGSELVFPTPRIIVFANWSPFDKPQRGVYAEELDKPEEGDEEGQKYIDMESRSRISRDRWQIGDIVPMSSRELLWKLPVYVSKEEKLAFIPYGVDLFHYGKELEQADMDKVREEYKFIKITHVVDYGEPPCLFGDKEKDEEREEGLLPVLGEYLDPSLRVRTREVEEVPCFNYKVVWRNNPHYDPYFNLKKPPPGLYNFKRNPDKKKN